VAVVAVLVGVLILAVAKPINEAKRRGKRRDWSE